MAEITKVKPLKTQNIYEEFLNLIYLNMVKSVKLNKSCLEDLPVFPCLDNSFNFK